MSEPVLEVEGLIVDRDRTPGVVRDVSFTLSPGTDTALIGPNGAGKSTLIQAILGILPRKSGKISILGKPLTSQGKLPAHIRQQIAYLPQNFLFDRRLPLTVAELVGLGWDKLGIQWPWSGYRERRQAVRESLSRVDAWHLKNKPISQLSGGETKRVLLAYCLARPRKLLILDEAPAGLDISGEAEFYQLLEDLKQEYHWAILQISHDLEMVRKQCDRVLCLNRTLLCQGTPETTLSTENLIAAYGSAFARYHHHHSCPKSTE
ncbi:metal ABC transporter ATP-binding protein [Roseofilum sp. BLCC_M91]|uniref:Metal ABC transporter ATP-binding protein n=1 Tax=Roseofilum halophilum BLCC-M91 TaxID=3022259 RepID=A0ABT7BEN5_9CYAN|nr:metal ABC transporter ATP-binding protein [Roseofilum halophilum]MDJ1177648.1 metal ABC transporter ATP-binding protein [Roseofilum halophilum BLCC-M91]